MRPFSDFRPYQHRATTHLYEHDAVQAVLPMGAGKTAVALTAIKELIEDGEIRCALVLAPKRVAQLVWPKEVTEWEHLTGLRISLVSGTPAQRAAALEHEADVYVVGVDNAQWLVEWLQEHPESPLFDLLCIDELSRFKNPTGKRAKALAKIIGRFKIRWGLTGTPRPNGWLDQFMPMRILTNGQLWGKSFYKWREQRFMPLDWNGFNWSIRPEWRDRTLADVNRYSITISEADMPELPEINADNVVWVDLPTDARKAYGDMERKLMAQLIDRDIVAPNAAVAAGKLCQLANGFVYGDGNEDTEHSHDAKIDALTDLLEGVGGAPVLIAYEFQEDLRRLRSRWPNLPYLGAGVSDRLAAQHEVDWNQKKLPMLAIHPASAGHGLNLQGGGSQMIWYGMTWSAELYDQTIKRIHRPGQRERCFVHHILARDTVDEVKWDRVHNKMSEQEAFRRYLMKV